MTIDISEKEFENAIETVLLKGGFEKRLSKNYDKKSALDKELLIRFIKESQQEKYEELQQIAQGTTDHSILEELEKVLDAKGMLYVINNGFSVSGITFESFFLKPTSKINEETLFLYERNILSLIRQIHYSQNNQNSVDIVLFLNGLPIASLEIKNPFTGQTFSDAIIQYKNDRNPSEKLFEFKKRVLVFFAIDPDEIHYSTRLNGEKTEFFPFNKGRQYIVQNKKFTCSGNPDTSSYKTEYFWKEILQKDSFLDIVGNYIQHQSKKVLGEPVKESIIFPRYHQLDAVRKLESKKELGCRYLIQHSTGGGKSNTIGWLAYKLFSLFDETGEKAVFDSVLVLSDRINIVSQLAETIQQFEQTPGIFEEIKNTPELVENLGNERKILVSTQQKFLNLLEKLEKRQGKNFAIIIDEAHSSQSGTSATKRDQTLTEDLTKKENPSKIEDDPQDAIFSYIEQKNKKHKQLNYYAFTATPKETTLHLFGVETNPNIFEPFHTYSMRQAIEEGFILDVLKNYTTYEQHFKLIQTSKNDKIVEGKKASREIMMFVESHELNISKKSQIIVEHFLVHTKDKIGGMGKAMVVAPSRLAAVRYKLAIDTYIESKQYSGINTLVAFSGTVIDDNGKKFTENSMNSTKNDKDLREKFDTSNFNILVVADKYQTGFNQPLLHTMYVDKHMYGIKPVQTLSRLNRAIRGKDDTYVLDFKNSVDEIRKAFEPYYDGALLADTTNLKMLDGIYRKILNFDVITRKILHEFSNVYYKKKSEQTIEDHGKLSSILNKILSNYDKTKEIEQSNFKLHLIKYVEIFRFLSHIIPLNDEDFHALYGITLLMFVSGYFDAKYSSQNPIKDDVALEYYRLQKTSEGKIPLSGEGDLVSGGKIKSPRRPEIPKSLSEIIQNINERNSDLDNSISEEKTADELEEKLDAMDDFQELASNSDAEDIRDEYTTRLKKLVAESYDSNPYFARKFFENGAFQEEVIDKGLELCHKKAKGELETIVISPGKELEVKIQYRKIIEKLHGKINWFDRYFGIDTLEFLETCTIDDSVKEIKILASAFHDGINQTLLEEFQNFVIQCKSRGIKCEMRIITRKELHKQIHMRAIISDNHTYVTESQKTIEIGSWSLITEIIADLPYDEWWNHSDCHDIVKDWDKISPIINHEITKLNYPAKCIVCGKDFTVPFKPDGIRPVYCREHLKKSHNRGDSDE
jgi:type I restriction enzyme, R subunit